MAVDLETLVKASKNGINAGILVSVGIFFILSSRVSKNPLLAILGILCTLVGLVFGIIATFLAIIAYYSDNDF